VLLDRAYVLQTRTEDIVGLALMKLYIGHAPQHCSRGRMSRDSVMEDWLLKIRRSSVEVLKVRVEAHKSRRTR
jgi:hypothetical protein